MPELDAGVIVRCLNRHGVRYVIIGGLTAQLHDLPVADLAGTAGRAAIDGEPALVISIATWVALKQATGRTSIGWPRSTTSDWVE